MQITHIMAGGGTGGAMEIFGDGGQGRIHIWSESAPAPPPFDR